MNLVADKKITLIYKHSRLAYAQDKAIPSELKNLANENDTITQKLTESHESNLRCIDHISSVLDSLGLSYRIVCRSDIRPKDIEDRFIISVGGDGTVLETSHHCVNEPVLGVNSDPKHSIGALCIATQNNFRDLLEQIYQGSLKPSPIQRLALKHQDNLIAIRALNDILFCHQNPGAMSRFSLSSKNKHEVHRSSGIWVASAAGSTGGIFSSGGEAYPIEADCGIFRVREPYWSDHQPPALLFGSADALNKQREKLIVPRLSFRKLLRDGEKNCA